MKRRKLLESSAALTGAGGLLTLSRSGWDSGESKDTIDWSHDGPPDESSLDCQPARKDFQDKVRPDRRREERPMPFRELYTTVPDERTYGYESDGSDGWVGGGDSVTLEVDMGNMARKDQFDDLGQAYYLLETDFSFRADLPVRAQCCEETVVCEETVTVTDPPVTVTDTTTETPSPTATPSDTSTPTATPTPTDGGGSTPDPCVENLDIWLESIDGSTDDCPDGCVEIQVYAESCDIQSIYVDGTTCDGTEFGGSKPVDCADSGSYRPDGACFEVGSTVRVRVHLCDREFSEVVDIEVPPSGEFAQPSADLPSDAQAAEAAAPPGDPPEADAPETERRVRSYYTPAPLFVQSDPDDDSDRSDPDGFPPHLIYLRSVTADCEVDRQSIAMPLPDPPFRLFSLSVNGQSIGRWDAQEVSFVRPSGETVPMKTVKQHIWQLLTGIESCEPHISTVADYLATFESVDLDVSFEATHGLSSRDPFPGDNLATVKVPVDVLNDDAHQSEPDGEVGTVDVQFEVHQNLFGAELNVHDVLVELAAPPVVVTHGWSREWDPDNPRSPSATAFEMSKDDTFHYSDIRERALADLGQNPWYWAFADETVGESGRWDESLTTHKDIGSESHGFFFLSWDRKGDVAVASKLVDEQVTAITDDLGYSGGVWAHAHSMGGVVLRHYLKRRGDDARIEQLSMDGTPNIGTQAGNYYVRIAGGDYMKAAVNKALVSATLGALTEGPVQEVFAKVATAVGGELADYTLADLLSDLEELLGVDDPMAYISSRLKWLALNGGGDGLYRIDPTSTDEVNFWWVPDLEDPSNVESLPVGGEDAPWRDETWWERSPRRTRNAMNDIAHREYCVDDDEICLSPNTNRWYRVDARFGKVVEMERRDHLGDFQTMRFEDNVWMQEKFEADRLALDDDQYFVVWGKFDPATSRVGNVAKDQLLLLLSDPSQFYTSGYSGLGLPDDLASTVGETMEQFIEILGVEPLEDGIVSAHSATMRGRLPNRRVPAMHNYIPSHTRTKDWLWRYHAHLDLDTGEPVADHASYVTDQDAFAAFRTEQSGENGADESGTDAAESGETGMGVTERADTDPTEERWAAESGHPAPAASGNEASSPQAETPNAAERSASALEAAGFEPVTDRPLPATVPVPTGIQSREEMVFVPSLDGQSRHATVTTTVGPGLGLLQVTVRTLPTDDSLAVALVDPGGTVHDDPDESAAVYRREGRSETGSFQTWFVGSPAAGEWTVRVSLVDGVAVDDQFHVAQVMAIDDSPVALTAGRPRKTVDAGESIRVGAALESLGGESPLDEATVTATVRAPNGTTGTAPLAFDEDRAVYVGEVGTASGGVHTVTTSATVDSAVTTAHRESTFTIDVAGPTDYREPTPTPTATATTGPEALSPTPTGTASPDGTGTASGATPADPAPAPTTATGAETPPESGETEDADATDGAGPGFGPVDVAGGLAGSAALFRWLSDRTESEAE